jgi:hypothetical protein
MGDGSACDRGAEDPIECHEKGVNEMRVERERELRRRRKRREKARKEHRKAALMKAGKWPLTPTKV